MSKREKLESLAAVRKTTVTIDGEEFVVRESGALAFADYGAAVKVDVVRAISYLLADSLLEDDGTPMFATVDEALTIARNQRTAAPLVTAILALGGFGGATEKEPDA